MSREIKFRAWDANRKIWVIERHFSILGNGQVECYATSSAEDLVIIQSTSLKDKNGKDIYEGDIIRQWVEGIYGVNEEGEAQFNFKRDIEMIGVAMISTRKGVVMQKAKIIKSPSKNWIGAILPYKNITGYRCEIIGNIWENPELLP